ncbi:PE-PPE domain-containing protein [Mycobacterium crocinum]|uniref:PE-PPE domain-containing protein n=1 Tax=Mycolicibacterium crocinum TaxID=388459 RepID=A0ABY3TRV9_9MYCO|nr:PE-PPE domain-containing protein [Mycolicibacterium crocinum]MCV7214482.1 PE-PPE domain-containing protein [Mycolicibacterium crocinum]ULN42734.1 PE-PPE domain-containing protein [Mycolicibacterium crocinum]
MADNMVKRTAALLAGVAVTATVTASVVSPVHPATVLTSDVALTTTVLAMGGLGYEDVDPELIKKVLGGYFANADSIKGLPWPGEMAPWNGDLTLGESMAVGLVNMDAAIRSTPGPKIVMGASGTTVVVDEEMRRLANDPTAPPADELSFVVMGDANRGIFKTFQGVKLPIFDYTPVVPETKYDVMVIKGEYDAIGDWPDRSWNLLADFNALAASGLLQQIIPEEIVKQFSLESWGSVHKDAMFVDPSTVPARNITTTTNALGGTTTTYLMPTADLPLLRPLKGMGWPQPVIDGLTAVLRPIVDSAYYRNDPHINWRPPRPVPAATVNSTATASSKRPGTKAVAAKTTSAKPAAKTPGKAGSGRQPH